MGRGLTFTVMSRPPRWFPAAFVGVLVVQVALAGGMLTSHWRHTGRFLDNGSSAGILTSGRQAAMTRAVAPLLERRGAAVLNRDQTAFLRTVDSTDRDFGRAQARLYQRLSEVPLREWSYRVKAVPHTSPALAAKLRRGYGAPMWIAAVTTRYAFADVDSFAVSRTQYLTFVLRDGNWLIGGDDDLAAQGLRSARELWDYGPVTTVRAGQTVVVGQPAQSDLLHRIHQVASRARSSVAELFPRWQGPLVVIVPPDGNTARKLLPRSGESHLATLSAVTTTESNGDQFDAESARVALNPDVIGRLDDAEREVVLRHEAAHVASRPLTSLSTPLWLSEGLAEYAAYRRSPRPLATLAPELTALIRRGEVPTELPTSSDFVGSAAKSGAKPAADERVAVAYREAWAACLVITQRSGSAGLVKFYEHMAKSAGSAWPAAARDVLSLSQEEFVALWREYLVDTFG